MGMLQEFAHHFLSSLQRYLPGFYLSLFTHGSVNARTCVAENLSLIIITIDWVRPYRTCCHDGSQITLSGAICNRRRPRSTVCRMSRVVNEVFIILDALGSRSSGHGRDGSSIIRHESVMKKESTWNNHDVVQKPLHSITVTTTSSVVRRSFAIFQALYVLRSNNNNCF